MNPGATLPATLTGGAGRDVYDIRTGQEHIVDSGGTDSVHAWFDYVVPPGMENVRLHGFARTLTVYDGKVALYGRDGDDVFDIYGGTVAIRGDAGNDVYRISDGDVTVIERAGDGEDVITTRQSFVLSAGSHVETLRTFSSSSTDAVDLTGNELVNSLVGNAAANRLDGKGGADTLYGYDGDDTYLVDTQSDLVVETANGGRDTVITSVTYALADNQHVELLRTYGSASIAETDLFGNNLANTIQGNAAANLIDGKEGSDTIWGYGGADEFVFSTAPGPANVDKLPDFKPGLDHIVLENSIFAGLGNGTLPGTAFRTGASALDADDRILYDSSSGALLFDVDGAGGAEAVQFATVARLLSISSQDFWVI